MRDRRSGCRTMHAAGRSGAWGDRVARVLITGSAMLAIVSLILIFIFIGKEALPIFTSAEIQEEANIGNLFLPQSAGGGAGEEYTWQPVSELPKYSLLPLLAGTLKVTIIASLIAIPLAVLAALYTAEFAPAWARETVKPAIELLAGIPSVVVGFFCLMVLADWLQGAFGWTFRLNAMTAGIGLSLAVIPIVYTVCEDAFSSVPQAYRDGSVAMGASSWQTASRVVLPAAMPGVLAACVLGFGRAIGETMIVLMASGNAAILSWLPTDSIRTFSATIAAELGEVVVGSPHYHVLFFIGAFLFVITFAINLLGHWWVGRLQKKLQGAS
ncbi:MAG: phosphate ABC transporter permease subunit PstC [Acidobacteria bacterium]|nr:phosphate ABC transporter permease subunit PstC [Acidobacteriota bacterium]